MSSDCKEQEYSVEYSTAMQVIKATLPRYPISSGFEELANNAIPRGDITETVKRFMHRFNTGKDFFCFKGKPDCGKSTILSSVYKEFKDEITGVFAFDYDVVRNNADLIYNYICETAYALACDYQEYAILLSKVLADYGYTDNNRSIASFSANRDFLALFDRLIASLVKKLNPGRNYVFLIDGVDEATCHGENNILTLLCSRVVTSLPKWFKIIFTTQKNDEIDEILDSIKGKTKITNLENITSTKRCIRDYITNKLNPHFGGQVPDNIVNSIATRSDYSFSYALLVCTDIIDTLEDGQKYYDFNSLPKGIYKLYEKRLKRFFPDGYPESARKPLEVIVAKHGSVEKSVLKTILGWNEHDFNVFKKALTPFVETVKYVTEFKDDVEEIVSLEANNNVEYVRFCSISFIDWIQSEQNTSAYYIDKKESIDFLLDYCREALTMYTPESAPFNVTDCSSQAFQYAKFIYKNLIRFGNRSDTCNVNSNFAFMHTLSCLARKYGDYNIAGSVLADMCNVDNSPSAESSDYIYYVAAKVSRAEVYNDRREFDDAYNILEEFFDDDLSAIQDDYSDLLFQAVENMSFTLSHTNPDLFIEKAPEYIDLFDNKDTELMFKAVAYIHFFIGTAYYYMFLNETEKGNYDNVEEYLLQVIASCIEAEQTLAHITDDEKEVKRLNAKILNLRAYTMYRRFKLARQMGQVEDLSLLKERIDILNSSLNIKREVYGEFSRSTAKAYDNLARAILDWQREECENEIDEDCINYAQEGEKINRILFGRHSVPYARSIQTLVFIYEHLQEYDTALTFAKQQYDIFTRCESCAKRERDQATRIYKRIQQYVA